MFSFIFTTTVGILCLISLLFSPRYGESLALLNNGVITKRERTILRLLREIVLFGILFIVSCEFYQKTFWWSFGIIAIYWVIDFILGFFLAGLIDLVLAYVYNSGILDEPDKPSGRYEVMKTIVIIKTVLSILLLTVAIGLFWSSR